MLSQPSRREGRSGGHPRSRPPWNAAAAALVVEMQHNSRSEELRLRVVLGLPKRYRGGSDANTLLALDAILALASTADDESLHPTNQWLGRWNGSSSRVLGDASAIVHLPRQPGEPPRPCPFCECLTLRYWPLNGMVRCINPACRDSEGRRPSARIEYSTFTCQLELVWHDGVTGLPASLESSRSAATAALSSS